jgi:peptidoglycan hydrolase CwlO-like protein
MKKIVKEYYKEILIIIMSIVLIILLIKIFTPAPDKSDLLKYKLEQLDLKINELKDKQKAIDDSISKYKNDIKRIDDNIDNIRTKRTTINNYYEIKDKQIPGYTPAQIDSALRKRYNY